MEDEKATKRMVREMPLSDIDLTDLQSHFFRDKTKKASVSALQSFCSGLAESEELAPQQEKLVKGDGKNADLRNFVGNVYWSPSFNEQPRFKLIGNWEQLTGPELIGICRDINWFLTNFKRSFESKTRFMKVVNIKVIKLLDRKVNDIEIYIARNLLLLKQWNKEVLDAIKQVPFNPNENTEDLKAIDKFKRFDHQIGAEVEMFVEIFQTLQKTIEMIKAKYNDAGFYYFFDLEFDEKYRRYASLFTRLIELYNSGDATSQQEFIADYKSSLFLAEHYILLFCGYLDHEIRQEYTSISQLYNELKQLIDFICVKSLASITEIKNLLYKLTLSYNEGDQKIETLITNGMKMAAEISGFRTSINLKDELTQDTVKLLKKHGNLKKSAIIEENDVVNQFVKNYCLNFRKEPMTIKFYLLCKAGTDDTILLVDVCGFLT